MAFNIQARIWELQSNLTLNESQDIQNNIRMNLLKSIIFGALVGFSSVLLHNFASPFGLIASLILTYLGIRIIKDKFFYMRYQILSSAAWLGVVIAAGTPGVGDEILIIGNTNGNLFLVGGFLSIIFALVKSRSRYR